MSKDDSLHYKTAREGKGDDGIAIFLFAPHCLPDRPPSKPKPQKAKRKRSPRKDIQGKKQIIIPRVNTQLNCRAGTRRPLHLTQTPQSVSCFVSRVALAGKPHVLHTYIHHAWLFFPPCLSPVLCFYYSVSGTLTYMMQVCVHACVYGASGVKGGGIVNRVPTISPKAHRNRKKV
ncbi:unnamed protein product [Periconia digitata]|uniref:Uncharacterized protein n=1 Tax=Periconia digitata TaxID=1303443 RepID=A0A9W4XUK1_9PLEO|nr:unnamed protein product [Periconia digitata]